MASASVTMMPFLYPCLLRRACQPKVTFLDRFERSPIAALSRSQPTVCRGQRRAFTFSQRTRRPSIDESDLPPLPDVSKTRSLNPTPEDYSSTLFADTATITAIAGSGGHGCISFLREKFIAEGPANGGDGGTGGNVYIQAVPELKSLHKIARRREVRAGNGKNGQGKSKGGQRGADVVIEVPVGTVIREVERWDPVEEAEREYDEEEDRQDGIRRAVRRAEAKRKQEEKAAEKKRKQEEEEARELKERERMLATPEDEVDGEYARGRRDEDGRTERSHWGDEEAEDYEHHYKTRRSNKAQQQKQSINDSAEYQLDENGEIILRRPELDGEQRGRWRRDRWLMAPSTLPSEQATAQFPALPRPRRSSAAAMAPAAPIAMDLSVPSKAPILLAAGATGGLGNPHFATKTGPRPKFATKGNVGMRIKLQLELKLLADLGFVGLPNAGKSTLLRALSNSRARVGSWAFTTLVPNLGTVVLDDNRGRARLEARGPNGKRLSGITVADIPGLVAGASQDRGLGLEFLRHVERAKVLAFVIDLSAGDAVEALHGLWRELDAYEALGERASHERSQGMVNFGAFGTPLQSAGPDEAAVAAHDEPIMWQPKEEVDGEGLLVFGSASGGGNAAATAISAPSISSKPWFVVATKADLPDTQANFAGLQAYLGALAAGNVDHPATAVAAADSRDSPSSPYSTGPPDGSREVDGVKAKPRAKAARRHRWSSSQYRAVPASAIHGHGIERIIRCTAELLNQ